MRKFTIVISFIFTFLFIYLLQVNFFAWFNLAGIKPNLFIIFLLFIGLFSGKGMGTVFGISFGLALDLLIGKSIGISAIMLGMIGFLGGYLDKSFSKDSRITMIVMIVLATSVYEIGVYVFHYFIHNAQLNLGYFIRILIIELMYNTIITIILYPLLLKWGYIIEDHFKENKILTRYF